MPDREEVIKGLKSVSCYFKSLIEVGWQGDANIYKKYREKIGMAIALLKEQEAVVRCKDCKHYKTIHCTCDGCCISDDWYCADGEKEMKPE